MRAPATATPAPAPQTWAPVPEGAAVMVFREVLVGMLPYPSRRVTWTLIRSAGAIRLRMERETVRGDSFQRVDKATHDPARWGDPVRAEYTQEPAPASGGALDLKLSYGPSGGGERPAELPETLAFGCKSESVRVRPADAAQRPGRARGEEVAAPSWSPASTEAVPNALVCRPSPEIERGVLLPFTEALTFVAGRKSPKGDTAGVEWAFDNSDMVIQHGGLRWMPAASVAPP